MLRKNELIISDSNYKQFINPTVNGNRMGSGYIPRDMKAVPYGSMPEAPAFDMDIIDPSEWDARYEEKVAKKSLLSDMRLTGNYGQIIPSLDQNGQGYCVTSDTEVLTEKGWVLYPDYDWTSPIATVNPHTHAMEFQTPFEKHVYEYDGPMLYSTNRRLDFGVTPDHELYVRKWNERKRTLDDKYSFVRAGDLGWYAGFLAAPSGQIGTELVEVGVPGDREYDGDDFIAMLAVIVADGFAGGSDSTKNWVSFCSYRPEYRDRIQALAARIGFTQQPSHPNKWNRYSADALANWVRENCYTEDKTGSRFKKIPGVVKYASQRQIKLFLDWFNDRTRDGSQFYSSSKRLIDDLQELHLRIGKRASIGKTLARDIPFAGNKEGVIRTGEGYVLTVSNTDRLCIDKKKHLESDRYKGLVYCAAVPNHTLLTRRNGSVLISSNCWAYSTTAGVMLTRTFNNQPYVRLSAHAIGCLVKGYRDEGGWCGLSLKHHVEHGCPSVEYWKEKSMARSNDTPEMRSNAAMHKVTEGFYDLGAQVWDYKLTFNQIATCLLLGIPCAGDFMWWGHSVCILDLVRISAGNWGLRILNSWTDSWGDRGMAVLEGSKARPDGALAIRVTGASPA